MSAELRTVTVTLTIRDSEHLPVGSTPDEVVEEVKEVVRDGLDRWYSGLSRGRDRLACEPEVI